MQRRLFLREARQMAKNEPGKCVVSLALVSSLTLAPACTFVIGDAPHKSSMDAGTRDAADLDVDTIEPEDGSSHDSDSDGATRDADPGSDAEASMEAAVAAASDASEPHQADDAAADGAPADAAEDPVDCSSGAATWYPDDDEDGYGRSAESVKMCPKPKGKWAQRNGDCKDNQPDVHPEQAQYFGQPFMGANGDDSYDYDCSGAENGNPGQLTLGGDCGLLNLLLCSGTGYLQTARTGANVNAYCGSETIGTCSGALTCQTAMSAAPKPYQCR